MGRLDYQPTSQDHFYLRYIYQDTPLIAYFDLMLVAGESVNVQSTTHSIGGDWTHTFSPTMGGPIALFLPAGAARV